MNLKGKSIIVTGAAGGIGAVVAQRLAAHGGAVTCVDLDANGVEETAASIEADGGAALPLVADIATKEGNEAAVREAISAFGGLDVLHANAAIQVMREPDQLSEAEWDSMHTVNLKGPYLGIQAAVPAMRARGGGAIILTASVMGIVGDRLLAGYGATKGGLRAMCRGIATAYGRENIRCNTVCPADVEVGMLTEYIEMQPNPETARRELIAHYPLGRFASPQDVAASVAFLASDDAAYLTGIDIVVDGGLLAQIY